MTVRQLNIPDRPGRPARTSRRGRTRARTVVAAAALAALGGLTVPATAAAAGTGVSAEIVAGELRVTGSAQGDRLALRLGPTDPATLEVLTGLTRVPEFRFRRSAVTRIRVEAGGGDDTVQLLETFGVFTVTTPTVILGGDGSDRLTGGSGAEVLLAGAGDDLVEGRRGVDSLLLGSGADTAVWAAGDGADVVEGQTGADDLRLTGTSGADHLELSSAGPRIRAFLIESDETVDAAGTEQVSVAPGAGADSVAVNDLAAVGSVAVQVDLDSAGPGPSDGAADQVAVAGTNGADAVTAQRSGSRVQLTGLPASVGVTGADRFADRLLVDADLGDDVVHVQPAVGEVVQTRIEGGTGADTVTADGTPGHDDIVVGSAEGRVRVNALGSTFDAEAERTVVEGQAGEDSLRVTGDLDALTEVTLDGGPGRDLVDGGAGAEVLLGGAGDDQVIGHAGRDRIFLGADHDTSFWSPGDGDDVVEGQEGSDALSVTGTPNGDSVEIVPDGSRVRLTQNTDRLDLDGVDRLTVTPRAGADVVAVHDLSGTALHEVNAELAVSVGGQGGDGAADRVSVAGTPAVDHLEVLGDSAFLVVRGLPASTRVQHTDPALDQLLIDTGAGADTVSTAELAPGSIGLTIT